MKTFLLFILQLAVLHQMSFGQTKSKTIYGSFVLREQAFNYEFSYNPKAGNSFLILPLTKSSDISKILSSKIAELDSLKKYYSNESNLFDSLQVRENLISINSSFKSINDKIKAISMLSDGKTNFPNRIKKISDNNEVEIVELGKLKGSIQNLNKMSGQINNRNIAISDSIIKVIKNSLDQYKINSDSIIQSLPVDSTTVPTISNYFVSLTPKVDSLIQKGKNFGNYLEQFTGNLSEILSILNYYNPAATAFQSTSFNEMTINVFGKVFEFQLQQSSPELLNELKNESKAKGAANEELEETKQKLFYQIQTRIAFEDTQPIVAIIRLKSSDVRVYFDNDRKKYIYHDIDKVAVEFEDGTIKNLEVYIKPINNSNGSYQIPIRFRNNKPIGISGKFHPEGLMLHNIFCIDYPDTSDFEPYVVLGEIVAYHPVLSTNTEDYSPENSVVTLQPSVAKTFEELKKELTTKILDVRIFSDLRGLQEGQPNGLIQTEFSRKIDINTFHFQGLGLDDLFSISQLRNYSNVALLRYIEPRFIISKIDQKDKFLEVKPEGGYQNFNPSTAKFRVNNLDLYKYQFVRFGADLNLFKYNLPEVQLNFQGLVSFYWFGTTLADSLTIDYQRTTSVIQKRQIYNTILRPGFMIEFKKEGRWGLLGRLDYGGKFSRLNSRYSYTLSDTVENKKTVNTVTIESFIYTNTNSKFFFRFSHNWIDKSNNFNQIQFGILSSIDKIQGRRKDE